MAYGIEYMVTVYGIWYRGFGIDYVVYGIEYMVDGMWYIVERPPFNVWPLILETSIYISHVTHRQPATKMASSFGT